MSQTLNPDPGTLKFDLPDPNQENINTIEFLEKLERAWSLCDRFDLQTEIWRGRILRVIRDREKRGGEGRGAGFLNWLRDREISKTRAYGLIQLADSADDLIGDGILEENSVNNFSRRAFIETAQASPEVQQMISEAANDGSEITRKQVRRLNDEFTSSTSPLLPEEIRQRTQSNLLPPRLVAPLVKELSKLPDLQQEQLRNDLKKEPEIDCIKDVTSTAKCISKLLEVSLSLRAFQTKEINLEQGIKEAKRLDALTLLADAFTQAQTIESAVIKFHTAWKRIGLMQERLWLESGSSTPYLRELLDVLQTLCGPTMKVSLGELSGGKKLRLQIVEESPEQLDPPSLNL